MMRARELEASIMGLAVWDGLPPDGPGGTADCVREWIAKGIPYSRIDPRALAASGGPARTHSPPTTRETRPFLDCRQRVPPDIHSILVVDDRYLIKCRAAKRN